MFMSLNKMRESNWVEQVSTIIAEYKTRIRYSDQDIVNIFFHYHPGNMRDFKIFPKNSPTFEITNLILLFSSSTNMVVIFPDKLYVPSCTYNYRAIHCSFIHDCEDVDVHGVSVLHGWGGAFQKNYGNWRVFGAIYELFSQVST